MDVSNTYVAAAPLIKNEDDILNEELRKKFITHWNTSRNVRRKNEAFKAYECLKDKTNNYVMELLLRQFDLNTVIEMQYAITNVSILRKVIDKLAKVYANGAKRTMPKPEPKAVDPATANPTLQPVVPPAQSPTTPVAQSPASAATPVAGQTTPSPAQPPTTPGQMPPLAANEPVADPNAAPAMPAKPGLHIVPPPSELQLELEDPKTEALEAFCDYLKFDKAMRKCNRYYRTFANTLAYAKPVPDGDGKFDIKIEIVPPFHYDVVEQPGNPHLPLAIVLSDYRPSRRTLYYLGDAAVAGRGARVANVIDAPIQDYSTTSGIITQKDDQDDEREWVWWTKNYHFTTDKNGVIKEDAISTAPDDVIEESNDNPIGELPFEVFAGEQDDRFWAEGGTDLVESTIAINTDLTNLRSIGTNQGYGQMYMTGENLPKSIKVGPTHCIQMEYTKDQAEGKVGFLNSNAPIGDLKSIIETQVALMLTTNNLSTSSVAASMSGNKDFASGIALMIDKAESIEDINDQAKVFIEKEPCVLSKAAKMWQIYKDAGLLTDAGVEAEPPEDIEEEQVSFPSPQPILSEMDQLAVISKRKDLGLNTAIELVQRDNPGMSMQEAQDKLDRIRAEKMDNAAKFGVPGGPTNPTGMTAWPNPADGSRGVITAPLAEGGPAAPTTGAPSGNQGQAGAGIGLPHNNNVGPGPGKPPGFSQK